MMRVGHLKRGHRPGCYILAVEVCQGLEMREACVRGEWRDCRTSGTGSEKKRDAAAWNGARLLRTESKPSRAHGTAANRAHRDGHNRMLGVRLGL